MPEVQQPAQQQIAVEEPYQQVPNLLTVAGYIWLAGAASMLLYACFSYGQLRWRVSTATRLEDNICQSEYVTSPFVLGVFRPTVYLPYGLKPHQQDHILAGPGHQRVQQQRDGEEQKQEGEFTKCHDFPSLQRIQEGLVGLSGVGVDHEQDVVAPDMDHGVVGEHVILLNAVAVIRAIVFLNKEKLKADHPAWLAGFVAVYLICYGLTFTVFGTEATVRNLVLEFLPVLGMTATTISFRLTDAKSIRRYGLISSPSWLIYNVANFAIGAIICEVLSLGSIFIGMLRLDRKKKND
jgi:hypothetical protein